MNDDFLKEIEEFESRLIPKKKIKKSKDFSLPFKENKKQDWFIPDQLFEFNPNVVSRAELKKLGFSEKQSKTLLNYRNSGGRFNKKNDLLKIYGLREDQYNILEPFIILENKDANTDSNISKETNSSVVEINSATKTDLQKLAGIGEVYAERIIKYRKLLGGFYNNKQLFEVYGMDSARYLGIEKYIFIDTNDIVKININNAVYDSLIKHPYLNKYQTKAILKYKEIMGDFSQLEQIYENNLLTEDEFLKIKPYLKLKWLFYFDNCLKKLYIYLLRIDDFIYLIINIIAIVLYGSYKIKYFF